MHLTQPQCLQHEPGAAEDVHDPALLVELHQAHQEEEDVAVEPADVHALGIVLAADELQRVVGSIGHQGSSG